MPEGKRAFFLTVKATTAKNTIKEKQRQGIDWKKMFAIYLPDKGLTCIQNMEGTPTAQY